MGNVMSYSGIVAKIRAMQAKLLTDKDFENIANLRSVPEAIDYLKEKPAYAEYMNHMWRRCCTSPCMMTIQGYSALQGWSRRSS